VDVPFAVTRPYVDKATGRLVNPNDCDGDGLPDDWEMQRFGTLKYDSKTMANAPRIDLAARRVDPADADGDGLPDAWEMKFFGSLKYGPHDDLAEDGYDNLTRFRLGLDPTKPHLADPARKPRLLVRQSGGVPLEQTAEFWQKQDRLRAKLGLPKAPPASQPVADRQEGR